MHPLCVGVHCSEKVGEWWSVGEAFEIKGWDGVVASLEVSKTSPGRAWSNLGEGKAPPPMAGGWNEMISKTPSNPNPAGIP